MFRISAIILALVFLFTSSILRNPPIYRENLAPDSEFSRLREELDPWAWYIYIAEQEEDRRREEARRKPPPKPDKGDRSADTPPDMTGWSPEDINTYQAWTRFIGEMKTIKPPQIITPSSNGLTTKLSASEVLEILGLTEEELYEMGTTFAAELLMELQSEEQNQYALPELALWNEAQQEVLATPHDTFEFEVDTSLVEETDTLEGILDPFAEDEETREQYQAFLDRLIDEGLAAQRAAELSL